MHLVPRESESYGSTRIISRSKAFFRMPATIIAILAANFAWEAVRTNLHPSILSTWPFRFTILSDSTTATVLAVFVSLFMGRLQWARTLRPVIGFAIDDEEAKFSPDSNIWRIWIYNSGPGGAVIESVDYYVRFIDQPAGEEVITGLRFPLQMTSCAPETLKTVQIISCDGIHTARRSL